MEKQTAPPAKQTILIACFVIVGIACAWFITDILGKNAAKLTAYSLKNISLIKAVPILAVSNTKNISLKPQEISTIPTEKHAAPSIETKAKENTSLEDKLKSIPAAILPNLTLSGILEASDGNLAIVNDQILGVGDTIKGGKIIEITPTQVVVAFGDRKVTLKNQ